MEDKYSVNEVANHFRVTSQTIYRWTEDCKDFMSDAAHPDKKGKQYFYNKDDMEVFTLLDEMRQLGRTSGEILESLRQGLRGGFIELNAPKDITVTNEQVFELQDRFAIISKERDTALTELHDAQLQIAQLEAKAQRADAIEADLQHARTDIRLLERKIGNLEAKLEMHNIDPETGRKKE